MPAVRAILKVYVQIRWAVGGLSSPARTERLKDPSLAPKLAKLFWLIAEFWLPFTEMAEEMVGLERLQEGLDLMMQVLEPYLFGMKHSPSSARAAQNSTFKEETNHERRCALT